MLTVLKVKVETKKPFDTLGKKGARKAELRGRWPFPILRLASGREIPDK